VTWREIGAIGVGVPGAFDPRSQTVWAPNLQGWRKVALGRLMQLTLRRPTFVEGDRNVQALAEMWLGAGAQRSVRSLVSSR
jgi:glucokinase